MNDHNNDAIPRKQCYQEEPGSGLGENIFKKGPCRDVSGGLREPAILVFPVLFRHGGHIPLPVCTHYCFKCRFTQQLSYLVVVPLGSQKEHGFFLFSR